LILEWLDLAATVNGQSACVPSNTAPATIAAPATIRTRYVIPVEPRATHSSVTTQTSGASSDPNPTTACRPDDSSRHFDAGTIATRATGATGATIVRTTSVVGAGGRRTIALGSIPPIAAGASADARTVVAK